MSFIPAEELDDFDNEDGFIDMDSFTEEISSTPTAHFNQNSLTKPKYSSGTIGFGKRDEKNIRIFSTPSQKWQPSSRCSPSVSVEDLRLAILKDNVETLQKYLGLGLPIDEPLRSGWTALMYAAHYARPHHVRLLLKHGANASYNCDMFSPLMCACSATSGNNQAVEECVQILVDAGVDVNSRDRFHTTPLMLASREGYLPAVRVLVAAGAKLNMQDNQGWTALTMATQRSRKEVVLELLEAGADVNIQHADKLTVKDLAAHLPSDDMLALLERRPVNTSARVNVGTGVSGSQANGPTSSLCLLDSGDAQARLTDLRYGELEVFLLGLDLGHLLTLFQDQLIDLHLLMTLTEQDLINAGVEQLGARKKILDAVQAVHKKDWQPSSLVSIHYNKKISCADAVAIMANTSRHLRYACSTVVYVREQLKRHPETVMVPTDRVTPGQFLKHTEDAIKNAGSLASQIDTLKAHLKKEMSRHSHDPPDAILKPDGVLPTRWSMSFVGGVTILACLSTVAWLGRNHIYHGLRSISDVVNR